MTTTTTTTTIYTDDYLTEDEDENKEEPIIQPGLEDKFKDVDFSLKLVSNTCVKLSPNIRKWVRRYEEKYIKRIGAKNQILKYPRLETHYTNTVRYIILKTKYYSLDDVDKSVYGRLKRKDLVVLLEGRDNQLVRKDRLLSSANTEIYNLGKRLSYAWAKIKNRF